MSQPPRPAPGPPGPPPSGPGPAAGRQRVFEKEVGDAVRYERGLAVKCACCLLFVAVVLAARVYFFG
jgi:hypothetical protein